MHAKSSKQSSVKNGILASFSLEDFAAIRPFLEPIALKERAVLQEPRGRLEHIYFIEAGVVSLRALSAASHLEIAVVGYQGAVGISCLLGSDIPVHQSVVVFPGTALRIQVDELGRLLSAHPQISKCLLRYVQAFITQVTQRALCGVRHQLEQRLASWLCVLHDAHDSELLPVTHDHISSALGIRRPSITETLNRFEDRGLIRKMRGVVRVENRKRLEEAACSCCGVIANEHLFRNVIPRTAFQVL